MVWKQCIHVTVSVNSWVYQLFASVKLTCRIRNRLAYGANTDWIVITAIIIFIIILILL